MKFWFHDPFNLLGKWVAQPLKIHFVAVILMLLLFFLPSLWRIWELQQRFEQQAIDIQQKQKDITYQQKTLVSLQKQSKAQQLSPELAAQVMPVNQNIQKLATLQHLNQEVNWEFSSQPHLQLRLRGHFNKTRSFLTALLQAEPRLQVLQLQMNKDESGVLQTELFFLLKKEIS